MATIEEVIGVEEVLRSYGSWAHGDENPLSVVAHEWIRCGFTAGGVEVWLSAGCWNPAAAKALRAHDIRPYEVSERVERKGVEETLGYFVSNGDMTAYEVARRVRWHRAHTPRLGT